MKIYYIKNNIDDITLNKVTNIKNKLIDMGHDVIIDNYDQNIKSDIYQIFSNDISIDKPFIYLIDFDIKSQINSMKIFNKIKKSILSITTDKNIENNKLFYFDFYNNNMEQIINLYKNILSINKDINSNDMKSEIIKSYENTNILKLSLNKFNQPKEEITNLYGIKVTIKDIDDSVEYLVKFIDRKNNDIVYQTNLKSGFWGSPNRKWFTEWEIQITNNKGYNYKYIMNLNNKIVYIKLDSESLNETKIWLESVDRFRIKHNCNIMCNTKFNNELKNDFINILLVNNMEDNNNIYASYIINHDNDQNINPNGNTENNAKYFLDV